VVPSLTTSERLALDPDDAITHNNLGIVGRAVGPDWSLPKQRFAAADQLDQGAYQSKRHQSSNRGGTIKPAESVAAPETLLKNPSHQNLL